MPATWKFRSANGKSSMDLLSITERVVDGQLVITRVGAKPPLGGF
jgi:hypothetical protein